VAFLAEHLQQHQRDHREIDGLLRDEVQRVDPADQQQVEDEPGRRRTRQCDGTLVLA